MDDKTKKAMAKKLARTPLYVMMCPSRRPPLLFAQSGTNGTWIADNADGNASSDNTVARGDYAACAGDYVVTINPYGGPPAYGSAPTYNWDPGTLKDLNGVVYRRTTIKVNEIRRGSAHCIFVGEKYLNIDAYYTGTDPADNESLFSGFNNDNGRFTGSDDPKGLAPKRDRHGLQDVGSFGSPHVTSCNFVFCDGAVHAISYEVDPIAYGYLGNRNSIMLVDANVYQ